MTAAGLRSIVDSIASWIAWAASLAVLLLVAALIAREYGALVPYLPRGAQPLTLVYLAGALWLIRR